MAYVRQVPQNIMTVELKIFDFMTLKQFGISVTLILISFLIYFIFSAFSPWNIVIPALIVIVGAIVMFVPFNGEPFQEFISNYLEAMISPQRRIWHKKGIILKTAADKARIYQYGTEGVASRPLISNMQLAQDQQQQSPEQSMLDKAESEFLQNSANVNIDQPVQIQNGSYTPPMQKNLASNSNVVRGGGNHSLHENQANISKKTLFNSVNVSANNQNTVSSPSTTQVASNLQQKHQNQRLNDEAAVKNYIFGSIEDYDNKPVSNAVVYIKRSDDQNVLEFLYTNDAGEFKTNYEYEKGSYVIQVVFDDSIFNTVTIEHEPIDPHPVLIHPVDYEQYQLNKAKEESSLSKEVHMLAENGVFAGNYDASLFSLGSEYEESNSFTTSNQKSVSINRDTDIDIDRQNNLPQGPAARTFSSGGYYNAANNLFDEFNSHRVVNNYKDTTSNTPPSTNTSNPPLQNLHYFDFNKMPNVNLALDPSVNLPNSINGIIVGPNKQGLAGILIQVFDKNGGLVTSTITDANGVFHSFSPLPNGDYVLYLSKNNQFLVAFTLKTFGSIIPPKLIQFI